MSRRGAACCGGVCKEGLLPRGPAYLFISKTMPINLQFWTWCTPFRSNASILPSAWPGKSPWLAPGRLSIHSSFLLLPSASARSALTGRTPGPTRWYRNMWSVKFSTTGTTYIDSMTNTFSFKSFWLDIYLIWLVRYYMNMNRIGIIKFLRCVRRWTEMDVFSQKVRPFLAVFGRRRGFWTQEICLGFWSWGPASATLDTKRNIAHCILRRFGLFWIGFSCYKYTKGPIERLTNSFDRSIQNPWHGFRMDLSKEFVNRSIGPFVYFLL